MTGRHRAGFAALLFLSAFIAAGGCLEVAGGRPASGVALLLGALLGTITALLTRLNWRLLEANRQLLDQNARLLDQARQSSSLPPQ